MTDWTKLKVPDLKAELKKRGLAQHGLKAALVDRLREAENDAGSESEATIEGDASHVNTESNVDPEEQTVPTPSEPELNEEASGQTLEASDIEQELPTSDSTPLPTHEIPTVETLRDVTQSEDREDSIANTERQESSLPSVEFTEVIEDHQKRKRRSQSPPPSATDTPRKRARQDEDLLSSIFIKDLSAKSEDIKGNETRDNIDATAVIVEAESTPIEEAAEPGPISVGDSQKEVQNVDTVAQGNEGENNEKSSRDSESSRDDRERTQSPVMPEEKSPINNSQYRDILSMPSGRTSELQINRTDVEVDNDRSVAPAIHPATSSLYIRDFMRPLNASQLKQYLITISTPPGTTPDGNSITKFYLDPVRTHAFVSFTTTSAASRVRSELHEQVWPDERMRKPLWVDFVPSEMVSKWIDEEQASSENARSTKKWEVVYDVDEDRIVTVSLQETGSVPALIRKPSIPVHAPLEPIRKASVVLPTQSAPGVRGAPSGPRAEQIRGPRTLTPNDSNSGRPFQSTKAMPVIFYRPVDRETANKRLENIRAAKSQNPKGGSEINRYTFEDGTKLVDRGPEIFSGIRPPPGYRGRGGGRSGSGVSSYRGRGGGAPRSDTWRRDGPAPEFRDRDRQSVGDRADYRDRRY